MFEDIPTIDDIKTAKKILDDMKPHLVGFRISSDVSKALMRTQFLMPTNCVSFLNGTNCVIDKDLKGMEYRPIYSNETN